MSEIKWVVKHGVGLYEIHDGKGNYCRGRYFYILQPSGNHRIMYRGDAMRECPSLVALVDKIDKEMRAKVSNMHAVIRAGAA